MTNELTNPANTIVCVIKDIDKVTKLFGNDFKILPSVYVDSVNIHVCYKYDNDGRVTIVNLED